MNCPRIFQLSPYRYCCYLFFSLKTHNKQFEQTEDGDKDENEEDADEGDNDEKETPVLSMIGAFVLLTAITVCVAISSE